MEPFTIDGYQVLRVLSKNGATGIVYLATKPDDGTPCALKVLEKRLNDPTYPRKHELMQNEMNVLQQLDHPHIVPKIGGQLEATWTQDGCDIQGDYIALELQHGGELFDLINYESDPQGPINERYAKQLLKQMLSGLVSMHESGIANRDLKLENMFVSHDFKIKIGDYGYAETCNNGLLEEPLGTPGYMAPEIIDRRSYHGIQVDIFSLGVILFSMVTGRFPFNHFEIVQGLDVLQTNSLYKKFLSNQQGFFEYFEQNGAYPLTDDFKSLVSAMLHVDPKLRPTYQDIIQHPWFMLDCATQEEAQAELSERFQRKQAAQQATMVNAPTLSDLGSPSSAITRSIVVKGKEYVVRELTEEEKKTGEKVRLQAAPFVDGFKMPGSKQIPANVAAVDLLSMIISFCNQQGVDTDNIHVDEHSMKLSYLMKLETESGHDEGDAEIEGLLKEDDDAGQEEKSPPQVTVVSAEILKVRAEESSSTDDNLHVIELCGRPSSFFNDHFKSLAEHIRKAEKLAEQEDSQAASDK